MDIRDILVTPDIPDIWAVTKVSRCMEASELFSKA
jgi:hypothetical protein